MKVAVCEFNPIVGALEENAREIIRIYEEIATTRHEVDLVVFPEMAICGYPVEDLALSRAFIDAAEQATALVVDHLNARGTGPGLILGTIYRSYRPDPPFAYNVAALIDPLNPVPAKQLRLICKTELPNYGVFDEKRIFVPNDQLMTNPNVLAFRGRHIGILICEDGWSQNVPIRLNYNWGGPSLDVCIWINGSPYEFEKRARRRAVALKYFGDAKIPVIYANMCGAQDELVFDGDSFMLGSSSLDEWLPAMTAGERFRPNNVIVFDTCTAVYGPVDISDTTPSIYAAIVLGVRDYMKKQNFKRAVIGMSGGVDSALVAAIACDAVGPENVDLIGMPSKFSSEGSVRDAQEAADRLGASYRLRPIEDSVMAVSGLFAAHGEALSGIAAENIQARMRGLILMGYSNQEGSLLLTTGNKSEVSVGYSTLYGDMAGGFNPLKDVYKTTAWDLCRFRNGLSKHQIKHNSYLGRDGEVVPAVIIDKPPSAELAEGQHDDQSLPSYPVLDAILKLIIEDFLSNDQIVVQGFDRATVDRVRTLVDRAEYKRRQAAPGVKITSRLHGRDRRVPIVNKWHG